MKISELRKAGDTLGRPGMAELAQDFIRDYDGSNKGVMELCGKLSVIAKMSTCDDYWNEQVNRGASKAEFKVELINSKE
jgi:hypothetical protein